MIKGTEIRKKRKQMGLSAQGLAELLKVKVENLYKWEKGTKPTDPEDYIKLENWLSGKIENVPRETVPHLAEEAKLEYQLRKQSLEKSIENLTQNELRTTAIIERLVALLESQYFGKSEENKKAAGTPAPNGEHTSKITK
ncbi:MAG: helix-turn-helix domain-containing protein [Flavisolibacter sp.]|jgi:predicted transcriptional regulator